MKKLFSSILWSFRLAWKTCPGTLVSAALSLAVIACIPLSQSLLIGNTVSALSGSHGGTAWIYIVALALVVGINIVAQRWVISNMLILKSKVNYRAHRMLNNRLSTFPLSDIGSTKSQEDIRAAREAISKQELQVHTMSVMTLVSAFAMVLLLCLNIANVSIVAAIFAALCSLPLAIAMVILAKRDYAIYTLMYEDYRAENYYLDNLMAQSRAQELHLMRASRFFSQRAVSWRRRAAGRELSLESVRGIVSIVAGLLCSVLLFASLYFLVDSGADISYVAGSLIGIIACVDATQEVGYSFGQIINGALSVQQFRRVCDSDTYDHASEIKNSNPNHENISKIICKDVSVQYEGASSFALKNINLELMNNQMIAVVGASGAGKTTLINAILGITPIAQGSITYKGASSESKYNMLANVGLVSQDYGRYELTVRENLLLGLPQEAVERLGDADLWSALSVACADDFVRGLEGGLDAQLGESFGGVGLSGGQWQRLALARVVLRDAPVWVLDEPTSAVDAETEEEIFARLKVAAGGRLVVLVSHRAWTLRGVDSVVVLDGGCVVEQGTYQDLLKAEGKFMEIFKNQISEDSAGHKTSAERGYKDA